MAIQKILLNRDLGFLRIAAAVPELRVADVDFNVAAMSFSAGELAAEIKKHIPNFRIAYEPDDRQAIADSWPESIDDSAAREEWGWKPDYDLPAMTADMLKALQNRLQKGTLEY